MDYAGHAIQYDSALARSLCRVMHHGVTDGAQKYQHHFLLRIGWGVGWGLIAWLANSSKRNSYSLGASFHDSKVLLFCSGEPKGHGSCMKILARAMMYLTMALLSITLIEPHISPCRFSIIKNMSQIVKGFGEPSPYLHQAFRVALEDGHTTWLYLSA